ncbi:Uncharacterized protein AB751O23_AO_00180 [Chlamydiales bacterium SCGC AB-751-O23]|jgi:16S rRNA (cytosine967-C5)-methyltransferase|nr:Uncharacterized protein AB751O23_AO_00180 [Chlamydiales bacterium SCGC AB-751-O23]
MKIKVTLSQLDQAKNLREAACVIIYLSLYENFYASNLLERWKNKVHPTIRDYRLCQQICLGTIQRKLTFDFLAKKQSSKNRLKLKRAEKVILYLSLFQKLFLEKVPLYAIASEGKRLISLFASSHFQSFFEACLHQVNPETFEALSNSKDSAGLSAYFSLPPVFIQTMLNNHGEEQAKDIFNVLNQAGKTHIRYRKKNKELEFSSIDTTSPFFVFEKPYERNIVEFLSSDFYIQNATTIELTTSLCSLIPSKPQNLLDLCAAPGGKSFLIKDLYESIDLYMNDLDDHKTSIIKENLERLKLDAVLSQSPAQHFPLGKQFDLVLLDVPCSNTGVLHKRPEARWRLEDPQNLLDLKKQQKQILQHASQLVKPEGHLIFMTCSLLPSENEQQVRGFLKEHPNYKLLKQKTLLPSSQGFDGGFGALMKKIDIS